MKEIIPSHLPSERMELSIEKRQQKEKELIGNIVPHAGHTVWEINNETLEITKASFQELTFILNQLNNSHKEILIREGFTYVAALNKKNALKKFKQGNNGSKPAGELNLNEIY